MHGTSGGGDLGIAGTRVEICCERHQMIMAAPVALGLNVVVLGSFPYPKGMAATKRIQHAIDGLKDHPEVSVRVIVLRQSSKENVLSGIHRGTPYETVMGDLLRTKAMFLAPVLYRKTKRVIRRAFQPHVRNVLFVYGPPCWDNLPVIRYARRLGFKVVFDIVEDYDTAYGISNSVWHRVANRLACSATQNISHLADGIIVITSRLREKFCQLTRNTVPILYHPISVDMQRYPLHPQQIGATATLFYSGSFGVKDGLPELLAAFDQLAARHENVRLVLTGSGDTEAVRRVLGRIEMSPYRNRIEYRGYLDEESYYATLNSADIPCMTRVNTAYANAGFPFKLGEFLATGKPTIATRVSDVEYLLADRSEVMLIAPGDSDAIVQAVEYLIANRDEAARIGQSGQRKAMALFDYHVQGRALCEFLNSV